MLKTFEAGRAWFVEQASHAALSGTLIARWGNSEFERPGTLGHTGHDARLRSETVFAAAEHDNGWWETDARRPLGPDGWPEGLVDRDEPDDAPYDRWRRGMARFADDRPYASALIAFHAVSLYGEEAAERLGSTTRRVVARGRGAAVEPSIADTATDPAARFFRDAEGCVSRYLSRVRGDAGRSAWVEPATFVAHGRLVRVSDAMSLALCSDVVTTSDGTRPSGFGRDRVTYERVPLTMGGETTTIEAVPNGDGEVVLDPYPFETEPLEVSIAFRVFDRPPTAPDRPPSNPTHATAWWYAASLTARRFRLRSAR